MLNLLTDVAGIAVGHATDLALGSGVTAIVFEQPSVATAWITGGAPGTRDSDLLRPENEIERIDAIVFSGGSAFGLDAAGGAQACLREAGRGATFAGARVPLVVGAILFDLTHGGDKEWGRFAPYRDLGYAAACAARPGAFALGTVGAGTGATTATCKGGTGSASALTRHGHTVGALAAVNALGSVTVGRRRHFWAAPFERDGEFGGRGWPAAIGPEALLFQLPGRPAHPFADRGADRAAERSAEGQAARAAAAAATVTTATTVATATTPATATTLVLAATDAVLTPAQAHRFAIMANDGLARAIVPVHAPLDGDAVFAASTGRRHVRDPVAELTELGHIAALVVARAIARGVFAADALPTPPDDGAPGNHPWRDLPD